MAIELESVIKDLELLMTDEANPFKAQLLQMDIETLKKLVHKMEAVA